MSSASLPPLPALIPISVLRKSPLSNNNSDFVEENHRDCAPCKNSSKLVDEQRHPRQTKNSLDVLIDNSRSRDTSAAPQSRKIRAERHRKSNRQRDRRRRAKTKSRNRNQEQPISPRVNPIFVWVKQEDTRIVEVKCEDYDKRNRILLTKTPQGWRATPRTETLAHSQKEADDRKYQHFHHHRSKKSKKNKIKQKSTAVQVEDLPYESKDYASEGEARTTAGEFNPDWESPVNVESLLPSHKIHVHRTESHSSETSFSSGQNVNSEVAESAQIDFKCSADASPLDNLLAVAELEFNEQVQSGQWDNSNLHIVEDKEAVSESNEIHNINDERSTSMEDMAHLKHLLETCTQDENKISSEDVISTSQKEECDYTEEDENNLAMTDILSRLEQSLRSPDATELELIQCNNKEEEEAGNIQLDEFSEDNTKDCDNLTNIPGSESCLDTESESKECENIIAEEPKQEQPTDLSLKSLRDLTIEIPPRNDFFEQPTDLSIPKQNKMTQGIHQIYRPPSQSSDALQSPQPSGLPAVLPSPGIVSPDNAANISTNAKETGDTTPSEQAFNPVDEQKNPLDLGKCRKSASPTVTCSEEVKSQSIEDEPPLKKHKTSELKYSEKLKETDCKKNEDIALSIPDTKKKDSDKTPIQQLHQLLLDETFNIPDPMLVPKKILRKIIANPGNEIPELLKSRPELRLPEALEFPHLLQDPDILVITISQLEEIVKQQSPITKKIEESNKKIPDEKCARSNEKESSWKRGINEFKEQAKINTVQGNEEVKSEKECDDTDTSANAALNQLLWFPYMNQFEALHLRNPEIMMALANSNMTRGIPLPMNQSQLMSSNGFPNIPTNFRIPPYNNPFEMNMWQGSLMQTGLFGRKNTFSDYEMKNSLRDLMGSTNYEDVTRTYMHNQKYSMANKYAMHNQMFQSPQAFPNLSTSYMHTAQTDQMKTRRTSLVSHQNSGYTKKTNIHNAKANYDHRQALKDKTYTQGAIRMKPVHKLMSKQQQKMDSNIPLHQSKEKSGDGKTRQFGSQPIDLSGCNTTVAGKTEVNRHQQLIDSLNQLKYKKNEDVGEVGSTTASIEEMQEAHKHLWHPLFGTDKCHSSGWNLGPSMTMSSE